jgi:tetratricopeptide (TPR) repeat protein
MYKFFRLFIVVLILVGCKARDIPRSTSNANSEAAYLATFTEATKYALLGNYKNAVGLYNLCIKKFPQHSGSYFQLSNIYFSFKDIDNAKYYGRRAVELCDTNVWYLLHLANIYQYTNNIDSLIYLYEKVVKISDNPEYKYNLSVFYSRNGQVDKSMKLVDELESEIPDAREILRLKHMNYSAMHMQDSAVAQLEKLVKLFPGDIENYGLLAEYLSEINRYQYAEKVYRELLDFEPYNGLANFSYADFFMKQGKKDSAIYYYKAGFMADDIGIDEKIGLLVNFLNDPYTIKNDTVLIKELILRLKVKYPNDEKPYTVSAEFNIKRQKYNLGLDDLRAAIKVGAKSSVVWEQYVMISGLVGNYEDIYDVYKEALEQFPDKTNLYIYSSYALYELKKIDELIGLCDTVIERKDLQLGDKTQLMNFLADGYRWKKDYAKSDSIFDKILSIDPENLIVRNNYAYYLSLRNEKISKALELSKFTVDKEPLNGTYLDTYGWVLYVSGNLKEAFKYVERAIKNGGNKNPEVLDHYGTILLKLGKCSEAIDAWNYAIKYSKAKSDSYLDKIADAKANCK